MYTDFLAYLILRTTVSVSEVEVMSDAGAQGVVSADEVILRLDTCPLILKACVHRPQDICTWLLKVTA